VRAIRLGHDEQSGSLLVEAMDHACPLGITLARDAPTASKQGVH
jgi:hypothetical protein